MQIYCATVHIHAGRGDIVISLRDEIMHVKSYLDIQNNCFDTKVLCDIDIPENILNKKIIKLTLQPIVENSIIHGFKNYLETGNIIIYAELIKMTA